MANCKVCNVDDTVGAAHHLHWCPHYKNEPLPQPKPVKAALAITDILERLAGLVTDGEDSPMRSVDDLVRLVDEHGLDGDVTPRDTAITCGLADLVADEVRELAEAARVALGMMRIRDGILAAASHDGAAWREDAEHNPAPGPDAILAGALADGTVEIVPRGGAA